jgi:hypothetical protein
MFQWRERRAYVIAGALILVLIGALSITFRPSRLHPNAPTTADTLPAELGNEEFWKIVEDFSEPNGYFRSDNLLSNESGLQDVIPKLKERIQPGGVYIGVGPEQNFTYILAFEPRISFVVDIRRLNMLEHLLYKALFELSVDRADFVSRLFSRPRPQGLPSLSASAQALFRAYDAVMPDNVYFESNLDAVNQHLSETHGFRLSDDDLLQIRYILTNFYQEGPELSYSFLGSYYQGTLGMPKYRELMTATDGNGHNWGFLATEEQFNRMQELQRKNLVIPLVGDFAGPKTVRAVGRYMADHHAQLSAFYTSNVEMYLFQQGDDWKRFYDNVRTLPMNSSSSFIRFAAGRGRRFGYNSGYFSMRSQMWSPVSDVLDAVRTRKVDDYSGVLGLSQ